MRLALRRGPAAVLLVLVIGWLVLFPAAASAHPLGNFTVNLYSRLEVAPAQITVQYVVDMAEIPTFQQFGGARPDAAAQAAYLATTVRELQAGLRLGVNEQPVALQNVAAAVTFPEGQGGLFTTRLELSFAADVAALGVGQERALQYEDQNFAGRQGWHEIVVRPAANVRLVGTSELLVDQTDALRSYPADMLQSPLDRRTIAAAVTLGQSMAVPGSAAASTDRATDRFAALITVPTLTAEGLVLALLAAMGLGALHALAPGHGKTIVGAYLVGSRGTAYHAVFLGLTVTITHTLGVFALGLITLYASQYILPEHLYPWLEAISGGLIIVMGVTLLRQRVQGLRRPAAVGTADPTLAAHDDVFGADHRHGPDTHTHTLPSGPIRWRNLLALGVSGGLLPCPSALIVMLSAISFGRIGLGLVLIVAFSLGLAGVLTGIGLLFVFGRRWLDRWQRPGLARWRLGLRLVPLASAAFVTVAGVVITFQAVIQTSVFR